VGARFSAPVRTGPGAHPASCTMGTESFPGVNSGQGMTLTPHPLLVPWSRNSRAIPLLAQCLYSTAIPLLPQCLYSTAVPLLPQCLYSTAVPLLPQCLYSTAIPLLPQCLYNTAIPLLPQYLCNGTLYLTLSQQMHKIRFPNRVATPGVVPRTGTLSALGPLSPSSGWWGLVGNS
jgi:hypothetical protein